MSTFSLAGFRKNYPLVITFYTGLKSFINGKKGFPNKPGIPTADLFAVLGMRF